MQTIAFCHSNLPADYYTFDSLFIHSVLDLLSVHEAHSQDMKRSQTGFILGSLTQVMGFACEKAKL